ncbi:uncharacterized protein EDB91DRAFT_571179 [Suillus paluster]|uniref:uncharacterized protein n=1 Tax=Suillus paluster TaxID=48578 RepID=UPI001B8647D6|nr:uncharacterized protein EDB91DRAFT_571179 [Suillus paluster]KAG1735146.1 hypothetical protein EDB91DRAFT_571179 [Suillus paluster]
MDNFLIFRFVVQLLVIPLLATPPGHRLSWSCSLSSVSSPYSSSSSLSMPRLVFFYFVSPSLYHCYPIISVPCDITWVQVLDNPHDDGRNNARIPLHICRERHIERAH